MEDFTVPSGDTETHEGGNTGERKHGRKHGRHLKILQSTMSSIFMNEINASFQIRKGSRPYV